VSRPIWQAFQKHIGDTPAEELEKFVPLTDARSVGEGPLLINFGVRFGAGRDELCLVLELRTRLKSFDI
jgi:hypothetical protein